LSPSVSPFFFQEFFFISRKYGITLRFLSETTHPHNFLDVTPWMVRDRRSIMATTKSTHIVLLGSNWIKASPYMAEEIGVAVINDSEPSVSVREMACHSTNGEMALPTIVSILRLIAEGYADIQRLHPALKEVANQITRGIWDIEEAMTTINRFHHPASISPCVNTAKE
jgi:hypothetical protein